MHTFIPLLSERLILREFYLSDQEEVHEYAANRFVTRHLSWGPNTPGDTRAFLERKCREQAERPRRAYELAVTLKTSGRLIGGCALRLLGEPGTAYGEIGYVLNPAYWGRGYATEACRCILDFGFELGLPRIRARCAAENEKSRNVLAKAGLLPAEPLPGVCACGCGSSNVLDFQLTAPQWRSMQVAECA